MQLRVWIICGILLVARAYAQQQLTDPTRGPFHPDAQTTAVSGLSLTMIQDNGNNKYAVINNHHLVEGDMIYGHRVAYIGGNNVRLEGPGGQFTLNLLREGIRQPISGQPEQGKSALPKDSRQKTIVKDTQHDDG